MPLVPRPYLLLAPILAAISLAPAFVSGQGAGRDPRRGFAGMWNSATATPLERPRQLKDKPFFTPEEAAEWERQVAENNEERPPQPAAKNTGTGTYNTFFREFGSRTVKTLRTSIVTEPPDGRIPALTAAAAEVQPRRAQALTNP